LAALREFGATERAEKYALANPEPDHLELARAVIARIGPQNILVDSAGCWQYRDKGVWQLQEEAVLKQAIQCVLEDQGERVIANKVSGVSTTLRSHAFQRDHRFDIGNPETINCLNGQLELDDEFGWELKPHNRADYRTTQIPVLYDHSATAPMFMQFLDDVFRDDGDKEAKKKSLLELIGYTLTSHARHEKFAILIGPGANGKSVLLSVLEGLCGHENVAGVQPSNFNNKYQRAHLHGKLANIVTELRQGETVADAELKAITSGEPATVENKNQTPFVMRPFATCWFGSNHMPHTRDFSPALFRRAVIFRFGRTFATHEQDPNLKDKLLTELPGILKEAIWAYALAVLGGNGFTEAPSSLEEKKAWRLEADQVAGFVDECCISDPLGIVPIGELFNFYRKWASHQGLKLTLNKKNFRSRLTTLGFGQGPRREARTVSGLQIAPTMRAEVEGYQVNPLPFR
jgi:putative DNA primase/helicase